jgi:hypothetical protein
LPKAAICRMSPTQLATAPEGPAVVAAQARTSAIQKMG